MAARKKAEPAQVTQVTLDISDEKFQKGGNLFPTPKIYTAKIPKDVFENIEKAAGRARGWTGFMEDGDYSGCSVAGIVPGYKGKDTIVGFFNVPEFPEPVKGTLDRKKLRFLVKEDIVKEPTGRQTEYTITDKKFVMTATRKGDYADIIFKPMGA